MDATAAFDPKALLERLERAEARQADLERRSRRWRWVSAVALVAAVAGVGGWGGTVYRMGKRIETDQVRARVFLAQDEDYVAGFNPREFNMFHKHTGHSAIWFGVGGGLKGEMVIGGSSVDKVGGRLTILDASRETVWEAPPKSQ